MQDGKGRIQKDFRNGGLEKVTCKTGCPLLSFKDICKRDMKSAAIDIESWEFMVQDRSTWRHLVKEGIRHAENTRNMRQVGREISEKQWAQRHYPVQFSNVKDVIKTFIQKSVFSVTKDVVQ